MKFPTLRNMAISSSVLLASTVSADVLGIPYPREGEDPQARCALDIHSPEGAKDLPVIVWFHGGGLTQGERSIPEELKNQSCVVVAAGYRLSPQVKCPTYIEDAASAVAWVFENIAQYGGNPDKIFLSGGSAGGYLATMITLDKKYLAKHEIDSNRIAGLAPYTGQMITHFTIRQERGIPNLQAVVDEMAPLYHVQKDAPPILLTAGDPEKELLGRYEENAYFQRMMKLVGHPEIELVQIPGADHAGVTPPSHLLLLKFVKKHSPPQ